MSVRTPISLGDLVVALGKLGATDIAVQSQIAALLGLRSEAAENQREEPVRNRPESPAKTVAAPNVDSERPSSGRGSRDTGGEIRTDLLPSFEDPTALLPPDWAGFVAPLPASPPEEAKYRPAAVPLLAPNWSRGILAAALATFADDGPLDVDRIVDGIARGRVLGHLPRRVVPTLRRGAQLLVDISDSMTPFARDQALLIDEIRRTASADAVDVLRFSGCPSRGAGRGSRRTWSRYAPPASGRPIIMLTDLGIGGVPWATDIVDEREWLEFLSALDKQGHAATAFVPYGMRRRPARLAKFINFVPWDRSTTAGSVKARMLRNRTCGL